MLSEAATTTQKTNMMKITKMKMRIIIRKSLGILLKCSVIKNTMATKKATKKATMVNITAIKEAIEMVEMVKMAIEIRIKRCCCVRC